MELPKQINNTSERLVDDLKARLSTKSRLSIAAASFSIYAFEALKKELEGIEELRFIFTSPTFHQAVIKTQEIENIKKEMASIKKKEAKECQPQKKFALHQQYLRLKKKLLSSSTLFFLLPTSLLQTLWLAMER